MEHVALNDPNQEVREKAVFSLAQVREGKGVEALKHIAETAKDVTARENAVFWMGQQAKSKDVVQFLEKVVRKDKDPRVREKALHVLAHQAPTNLGVPALINLIENQTDKVTRKKAVFWIGQNARTEQAIRCLESVALEDSDAEIRKTALLALSHAPDGRGLKAVIKIGGTAKDAGTRKEAVFWLGQRAKSAEIIQFLETAALKDADSEVRHAALHALSHAPEGRGVEALKKVAETSGDNEIRRRAVFWLGQRTKSEDVIQFLENIILRDTDAEIRKTALLALSQARDGRCVKALMKIGGSAKDADTREQAIFWLGQQAKSEEVIQFLEKIVREDSDREVRKKALTALVHAHQNLGVPALINLAKTHPDNTIRREAIFWLGQSKDPRATEALVEIVNEMK
jgi:HEAT repeat protein